MNLKKATVRFLGLILFLLLLGIAYILLTINRNPVIVEEDSSNAEISYVIPNTIVSIADESDKFKVEMQKNIQLKLDDKTQVSTQITFSGDETIKNKVITFHSSEAKQNAVTNFESKAQFNKQSQNGITYFQSKKDPQTIYFFPDEHTLVVTEDLYLIERNNKEEVKSNTANLANNKDGLSFYFSKNDPHIEHFLSNLPDQLVNKFESVSGKLNHNEKNTSFIEIKMDNALYARTLELALPTVIAQIREKVVKVNGQFVINGTNVTLAPDELDLLQNSQQYLKYRSSKRSVYLLIDDHKQSAKLLDILINVIIGD
ncbi:MAG: hypothetical protein R2728_14165 [Chitinophagales bacterium]